MRVTTTVCRTVEAVAGCCRCCCWCRRRYFFNAQYLTEQVVCSYPMLTGDFPDCWCGRFNDT